MNPVTNMVVKKIPVNKIFSPENSRVEVGDNSSLMISLKQEGQLQPVEVTPVGKRWRLNLGHRRVDAAKKLGWKTVDAVVVKNLKSTEDAWFRNLAENVQRKDISLSEEGRVYRKLIKSGLTPQAVAARLGISKLKVRAALDALSIIPKEWDKKVVYRGANNFRNLPKGSVTASSAKKVAFAAKHVNLRSAQVSKVLNAVASGKVKGDNIYALSKTLKDTGSIITAIKAADQTTVLRPCLRFKKTALAKLLKKKNRSAEFVLRQALRSHPDFKNVIV
jgi:ParB/RepB/Spo0J family partition protein